MDPTSVAELRTPVEKGAAHLGTAFAVAPQIGLTAFHCVGDRKARRLEHREVELVYPGGVSVGATVRHFDADYDLALLAAKRPFPENVELHRLVARSANHDGARFKARGYPRVHPFADPLTVDGHIVEPFATIFDGVAAIELHSPQAGSGLGLRGLSGAPVVLARDPSRPSAATGVIGIVRWGDPVLDAGGVVSGTRGGQFYATPVEVAVQLWRELDTEFVAEAPPLPHEATIRKYVRQYTGSPERPTPFGGRSAELDTLVSWAGGESHHPFALVVAPPGGGKSALLVRLAEKLAAAADGIHVVLVPITARFGLTSEQDVLLALTARLAALHGTTVDGTTIAAWRDASARLLEDEMPDERHLLVLLDGLDETAGGWSLGDWIPAQLGAHTRLVVAARLTAGHPMAQTWLDDLGWDSDDTLVSELDDLEPGGVREVLASAGPAVAVYADDGALIERLHLLSGGDPLVLSLYLADLRDRVKHGATVSIGDLAAYVPGLDGFMQRWWKEQERLWGGSWGSRGKQARRVLSALAVALAPLERRDLLSLLADLDGDDLDDALATLDRFLVQSADGAFALGHPRLGEHWRGSLERDGELQAQRAAIVDWGRATLGALREGKTKPSDVPRYVVLHLGEHLEVGATVGELVDLLDPAWHAAWDARTGRHDGYLIDVGRTRHAAWTADDADVRAGRRAAHMTDELRAIAARVQARQRSARITSTCLYELVRHGRFSKARALDFVRAAETSDTRAEALAAIGKALSGETLTEAVALSGTLDDAWAPLAGRALAALVPQLVVESGTQAARGLLEEWPAGVARALARVAFAATLDGEERDALVWEILNTDLAVDDPDRDEVLPELTQRVPPPAPQATAVARATEVPIWNSTYTASWQDLLRDRNELISSPAVLSVVAGWLTEDVRQHAVERLLRALDRAVDHPAEWIARELASLAQWLDRELAVTALEIAERRCDGNPSALVRALVSLLAALPDPAPYRERVRALLPEVVASSGGTFHEENLAHLGAAGLADECLSLVRQLPNDSWTKANSVVALAPHLSETSTREFIARVDPEVIVGGREGVYGALLARLAAFGADAADDALRLASTLRDDDEMHAAAVPLAAPVAALLLSIHEIDDPALHCAAIRAANGMHSVPATAAAQIVKSFDDVWWRSAALSALLDGITPETAATPELLDAVGIVIRSGGDPPGTLDEVSQALLRFFGLLAEGYGAARAVKEARRLTGRGDEPMAWALAGAARSLAADEVAGALDVARGLSEEHASVALAAILAAHRSDETLSAWEEVILRITPEYILRSAALALRCLPDDVCARTLDSVLPGDAVGEGHGPLWVDTVVRVLPTLDRRRVDLVRQANQQANGSGPRGRILAAVAARLASLSDFDAAFDAIDEIPYTEDRALALRAVLPPLPDPRFPEWLDRIEAIDAKVFRKERALLAADACCRLATLERSEQWNVWSTRLPDADDWATFAMLLLARAAPVVNLHGPLKLMPLIEPAGDESVVG